jgi:solute carrier family 25 phosphate transporter 3
MAALRQLLPSSLYSPACGPIVAAPQLDDSDLGHASAKRMLPRPAMAAASPAEGKKIEMYSPEFYRASVIGGILSCGLTHTAVRCLMARERYLARGSPAHDRIVPDAFPEC